MYCRYLPSGTKVGDPRPSFLTVATYPFPGAYAAVAKSAKGGARIGLPHGGVATVDGAYPKSIHLAFPGSELPGRGLRPVTEHGPQLVVLRRIIPVGSPPASRAIR